MSNVVENPSAPLRRVIRTPINTIAINTKIGFSCSIPEVRLHKAQTFLIVCEKENEKAQQ